MASQVDFQTFDLDGQVHDLMWCGYNDEVVLMHTSEGTIYRSRDRGMSWKRLKGLLSKSAMSVADEDQEVSVVTESLKVFDSNKSIDVELSLLLFRLALFIE